MSTKYRGLASEHQISQTPPRSNPPRSNPANSNPPSTAPPRKYANKLERHSR